MTWCKNNALICNQCGKFCGHDGSDEWTYFGSQGDPPEPLDPLHCCKKCWPELKECWLVGFRDKGYRSGDYVKSRAEQEAAKECSLVWVHSFGIGTYGTDDYKQYCYVTEEEHKRLSALPKHKGEVPAP